MSKRQQEKYKHESFRNRLRYVTNSWQSIEKSLDEYREQIADDYFKAHPDSYQLFRNRINEVEEKEETLRKILYKHSVAVINHMQMIMEFINGNEEAKPIFFILGKQHKQAIITEKMFLEMKDSICRVIRKNLGAPTAASWELGLEYIYVNYVFPGMDMWLKAPSSRCYSVFAPDFKEPVIDKRKIDKIIEESSEEQLLSIRVKPPKNSETCSIFYHADVKLFINYILREGKEEVARKVVTDAFTRIKHVQIRKYNNETNPQVKESILLNPVEVFRLAVKNVTPMLWYINIKRSGTWYKVPTGITEEKAKEKAMKWLLEVSNDKDSKTPLRVQLANEILAAANYEGRAIAKKIEMHKMCEANRGYVNYWWT